MPWVSRSWVQWVQQRLESLERRQDKAVAQDHIDVLSARVDNIDRHVQNLYTATAMGVPVSAMAKTEYEGFDEDEDKDDPNDLSLDSLLDFGIEEVGDDAEPL